MYKKKKRNIEMYFHFSRSCSVAELNIWDLMMHHIYLHTFRIGGRSTSWTYNRQNDNLISSLKGKKYTYYSRE